LYLDIPYEFDDSLVLVEELMGFIQYKSHKTSEELAFKRGSFPNFKQSIYAKGTSQEMQ
jgi:ribonucleoside-diphosphate reductase alpha chain